jgi:MYXO-CTERM domain-containing protein
MRRIALAGLLIAALAPAAFANGRAPGTSTIHFRQGHENDIVAGMTFGALLSHDNGATWHWMCEAAVGYGGLWDPDYSYLQNGSLFATTFTGLKVSTDGCTFGNTPPGNLFVSSDEASGTDLLFAAADMHDDKIYKSTDSGVTFPTSATPAGAVDGDWYTSIVYAPGDATRVYLSGYRFTGSGQQTMKSLLLYKSIDGGATFTAMGQVGLPANVSTSASIDVVGVDPANANIVYVKTSYADGTATDVIYKSTNGGASWTSILSKADTIAFLVRSTGELVAGTKSLGVSHSTNGGTSWTPLANAPHINCLAENSAHEVWACTQNYGDTMAMIPSDGYGIMKSTDLTTWTGVLRYQDITGPVDCAAGTVQHDTCVGMIWCGLRPQLGITSTVVDCSALGVDGAPDAGNGSSGSNGSNGNNGGGNKKGCCDTGPGSAPPLVMGLLVAGTLLLRRRRPRET